MSDPNKKNPRTSPSESLIDEASREHCMRYLLGSMDDHEAAQFQVRLESEPAIGEELIAQSELICHLASHENALADSTVMRNRPTSNQPVTDQSSGGANITPWVAAIAASLLLSFFLWSSNSDRPHQIAKQESIVDGSLSQADEDLLIAQAWAEGPLSLALTSPATDEDADRLDEESNLTWESLDPNEESVLNWMIVAVNAGENHEG